MMAIGMLRSIDLDDEPSVATSEIGEVRADRELAGKLVASQSAPLQFKPEEGFCLIVTLTKVAGARSRAWFPPAAALANAFPHSVVA